MKILRLPPNCFGTGSEHKLNHLRRPIKGLRQQMDVRFCESRDHRREAYRRAVNLLYRFLRAPPKRASGDVCFLLTIDLHGGRPSVD